MKSKLIKERNEIFYVDKTGRKWDKKCLDELFDALAKRKEAERVLDYYTYSEG